MEQETGSIKDRITKPLSLISHPGRMLLIVAAVSVILGTITGLTLTNKAATSDSAGTGTTPKTAQQDVRTFRDFAEGVVKSKPEPTDPLEYVEGTHILKRNGEVPVALTSSVVDLSKYEGKKVKVFGETQKALKEGWLMDVGRVEEVQ